MRHIQPKKSKTVLYIAIVCIVTGVAVGIALYKHYSTPHQTAQTQHTQNKSEAKKQPAKTTVQIGTIQVPALTGKYTDDDSLWRLVNKTNPLTNPDYEPRELTKAPITVRPNLREDEQSLRTVLVPELQAMVAAAARDGTILTLGSGYRSPALQKFFFDNYAARDGVEAANKYSALPGQSEHQTGLALDFAAGDTTCYLEQCFADTPEGKWLASHAHEYGFILRYTREGEATTGYQFEPWHYRYVGKDLAGALYQENMLLEDAWPLLLHAGR